jgi:hypothetical protein
VRYSLRKKFIEAHSFTACSNKTVISFQLKNAVKMAKPTHITDLKTDETVNIKQIIVAYAQDVCNKRSVSV